LKPKNPYTFFDNYCLRTPLLSLYAYNELTKTEKISIEQLKNLWQNEAIQEAIFLASPELFKEIEKWFAGQITDTKKILRLESSFLKYISRMSSRCTPFGLFAGCSIGTFGKSTAIELESYNNYRRQTRFDMNFLVAFSQKLAQETTIKKQLLWYPNSSLYKIGSQYRYIEYRYNQFNRREHSIEAVEFSSYLETIIETARAGKKSTELATLLIDDEITKEEAEGFIDELIENQILISEIEPSVTGTGFLLQLENSLSKLEGTTTILKEIAHYKEFLSTIDQKIGNTTADYLQLSERLGALETAFELKYLFQTDMYTSTFSNQLQIQWGYKLKRALTFLNKISIAPAETNLKRFKEAFTKRYETQELPLAIALDTEVGIGYLQHQDASDSTSFLDDFSIPHRGESSRKIPWNAVHEILNSKLQQNKDTDTLQLEDEDFEHLTPNWNDLPDTMSTLAQITSVAGKDKMILSSVGGASAGNLLGRFTTGDEQVLKFVQHITTTEQEMLSKDKILAEVVHLPESRTGNVIRRATIRAYEIPYLGKSNLPVENQIALEDLMISVRYNTIVLRSKKLNKEIIPRLTNAHNYSANALPVYHFLCDLQTQNIRSGIGFYWGEALEKRTFLPRVIYKDFILSKARWKITVSEVPGIKEYEQMTEKNLIDIIKKWRLDCNICKFVQLIEGDNTLLINLDNSNSIKMWLDTVRKKKECVLEEFLFAQKDFTPANSAVAHQGQHYTNQFIFSFYNQEKLDNIKQQNALEKMVAV